MPLSIKQTIRLHSSSKVNKYDTTYFIEQAEKIHGNKYDYSKSQCFNATDKVEIICPIHGIFEQRAYTHMQGSGCKTCGFISSAKKIGRAHV